MFAGAAARQGVTLDLEGLEREVVVPGDATELDRMVSNLLGNAVKFSPDGGRVTLAVERTDGVVVLRCADQGWASRSPTSSSCSPSSSAPRTRTRCRCPAAGWGSPS